MSHFEELRGGVGGIACGAPPSTRSFDLTTVPEVAGFYRCAETSRNNSETLVNNIPTTNLYDDNRDGKADATNLGLPRILVHRL